MNQRVCIKCFITKDISDYYVSRGVPSTECKLCTLKRHKRNREQNKQNKDYVLKERERCREKYHKNEKYRVKQKGNPAYTKKHSEKYPEKVLAWKAIHKFPKDRNFALHHWSYLPEHRTEVIRLSRSDHYFIHRFMVYDQEEMMYRRLDNDKLLDTLEKHIRYFISRKFIEENKGEKHYTRQPRTAD